MECNYSFHLLLSQGCLLQLLLLFPDGNRGVPVIPLYLPSSSADSRVNPEQWRINTGIVSLGAELCVPEGNMLEKCPLVDSLFNLPW